MLRFLVFVSCFSGFVCFSGGCRKETNKSLAIIGKWELRKSSGGMSPGFTSYPPGNGNTLQFSDKNFQTFINGQLGEAGKYRIVGDPTVEESVCLVFPAGRYTNRIIYDSNSTSKKQFIEVSPTTLTIVSGCYALDAGQTREYERQ